MKVSFNFSTVFLSIVSIGVISSGFFLESSKTESLTPQPKFMNMANALEEVSLSMGVQNGFIENHAYFFDWLNKSFESYSGIEKTIDISLEQNSNIPDSLQDYLSRKSAYFLNVDSERIQIIGADTSGVLNALTTLKKLLEKNEGKLSDGYIIDWPDHSTRAFHFVARNIDEEEALDLLENVRNYNFNTLVVQLADGVKLESMEGLYRRDAWTKDFLREFSLKARELGIEFIPEIKFLTHQTKLFKDEYPQLMYNRFTYDPNLQETRQKVEDILNELTNTINISALHIGHDELFGAYETPPKSDKKLQVGERALSPEMFLESINFFYDYLKQKNIQMWMWGDMFLDRPAYPTMYQWNLHGNKKFASLINEIPNDIVLCDWHYRDTGQNFPTAKFFIDNGFKTIGVTWEIEENIQNFSRYLHHLENDNVGMMATTWFHVQRDDWDMVEGILKTSSENFWNAN